MMIRRHDGTKIFISHNFIFICCDTTTHPHFIDWKAYLFDDMKTSTRINAFLWNRVTQGYSRVVKDDPPFESWRAWRAGPRVHKPVPYLTPTTFSSPVGELPSELDGVSAAAAVAVAVAEQATTTTQGSSSNCGAGVYVNTGVRTAVTAPPMQAAAAAMAAESAAASPRWGGVGVGVAAAGVTGNRDREADGGGNEEAEELEYSGYEGITVLTANLTGPPKSQKWALPSPPSSSQSQSSSSSSSLSSGGPGRLREGQFSFKFGAPEYLELAVVQCIFTKRMEDVKTKSSELGLAYNLRLPTL
jgi:hypothetical protein